MSDENMLGMVESEAWNRFLDTMAAPALGRLASKLLNDEAMPEVERKAYIRAMKEVRGILLKPYEAVKARPPKLLTP